MEDLDQEGMERILVLLDAGHSNGIRNRWRTRAKAKTDSRRGQASAYQNRADQRAAVIRSGRQGLLETDGVPHHRRSRLSRVVDGAPHKTRHRTTVGGELGPHRRQTGADGGHHRHRQEMAADGVEPPWTLDGMGHRRRLRRSAGHLLARHRHRHKVLHRKAGRMRRPCR